MLNDTCTTISSISIECFVSHDIAVATNVFLIVTEMPTFSLVWNSFGLQRKGFFTFVPECTSKQTLWRFNLFCFANKFSRQHKSDTNLYIYLVLFCSSVTFFCMSVLYFLKARRVMLEPKGSLIVRRLAPNAVLARQLPNQWTWLDESIVQFFITHLKLCEKWEKSLPASNIAQWDEIWRKSIAYIIVLGFLATEWFG